MKKLLIVACLLMGGLGAAQAQQTSPIWPGCEDSEDVSACFNQQLSQHVRENYVYPKNDAGEYVRGKVTVSFTVDEEGVVVINSVEGPQPQVNEAARVMLEKIPDMEPGTLEGEPDDRDFTIPFNF